MSKVILDASALLALINDEPGADKIEPLIGQIMMSSVNLAEVASKVSEILDDEEQCKSAIEPFVDYIMDFDKSQSYITAALKNKTKHKGLSLGDRACLALGIQSGLTVYTADKIWAELDIANIKIKLIR